MHAKWLLVGAVFGLIGVAAGAFGAHALAASRPADLLAVYETAVRYELIHALALMIVGLAAAHWPDAGWGRAGWLFTVGTLIFSGSLYALSMSGARWLGAITPLGGVLLLGGWALAALAAARSR